MRIVNERLTVRQTEDEVARLLGRPLPSEIAELKAAAKQGQVGFWAGNCAAYAFVVKSKKATMKMKQEELSRYSMGKIL